MSEADNLLLGWLKEKYEKLTHGAFDDPKSKATLRERSQLQKLIDLSAQKNDDLSLQKVREMQDFLAAMDARQKEVQAAAANPATSPPTVSTISPVKFPPYLIPGTAPSKAADVPDLTGIVLPSSEGKVVPDKLRMYYDSLDAGAYDNAPERVKFSRERLENIRAGAKGAPNNQPMQQSLKDFEAFDALLTERLEAIEAFKQNRAAQNVTVIGNDGTLAGEALSVAFHPAGNTFAPTALIHPTGFASHVNPGGVSTTEPGQAPVDEDQVLARLKEIKGKIEQIGLDLKSSDDNVRKAAEAIRDELAEHGNNEALSFAVSHRASAMLNSLVSHGGVEPPTDLDLTAEPPPKLRERRQFHFTDGEAPLPLPPQDVSTPELAEAFLNVAGDPKNIVKIAKNMRRPDDRDSWHELGLEYRDLIVEIVEDTKLPEATRTHARQVQEALSIEYVLQTNPEQAPPSAELLRARMNFAASTAGLIKADKPTGKRHWALTSDATLAKNNRMITAYVAGANGNEDALVGRPHSVTPDVTGLMYERTAEEHAAYLATKKPHEPTKDVLKERPNALDDEYDGREAERIKAGVPSLREYTAQKLAEGDPKLNDLDPIQPPYSHVREYLEVRKRKFAEAEQEVGAPPSK